MEIGRHCQLSENWLRDRNSHPERSIYVLVRLAITWGTLRGSTNAERDLEILALGHEQRSA